MWYILPRQSNPLPTYLPPHTHTHILLLPSMGVRVYVSSSLLAELPNSIAMLSSHFLSPGDWLRRYLVPPVCMVGLRAKGCANPKLSTNVLYVFIPQSQSSLHVVVRCDSRFGLSFFEECPGLAILLIYRCMWASRRVTQTVMGEANTWKKASTLIFELSFFVILKILPASPLFLVVLLTT